MLRAGLLLTAGSLLTASLVLAAGPVRVNGSTTVNPIVVEAAEALRSGRGMTIHVDTQGGSSGGIAAIGDGRAEVRGTWEVFAHWLYGNPKAAPRPRRREPPVGYRLRAAGARFFLEWHAFVLVTHNLRQARRVADSLACLCVRDQAGEIVESGLYGELFESPRSPELVRYLSKESQ